MRRDPISLFEIQIPLHLSRPFIPDFSSIFTVSLSSRPPSGFGIQVIRAGLMAGATGACVFCQIARSSTATTLLYNDERVVAFQDINPSAFRHYLVISIEHIPTVKDLKRSTEDYQLVNHMLNVGQTLLHRDAPASKLYRFGFHRPPLNSVNHLHLHCLALPFIPRWKHMKYISLGPFGGFIEAEKLLERIKPLSAINS